MKKMFIFFLFLLFFPSFVFAEEGYPYINIIENEELFNVKANHVFLYNLNDEKMVLERNSDEKISIASLTKIMTALVTILKIENLEEELILMEEAFYEIDGYAEAGFKIGDRVTVRDLLYGTLLPSGVEAAQSLALHTSGSIEAFVEEMNALALLLDMQNTHFDNPVGRDSEENYSTLRDLAKLLFFALQNETFYQIYTTRFYVATNGLEMQSTLVKPTEKYHLDTNTIKGSKSGYTSKAGLCLSSIAEYNGMRYLLLVANSPYQNGFPNHIVDSLTIYDYLFSNFSYQPILKENQELATLHIVDSKEKDYVVKSDQDVFLYLKNDMVEKLEYSFEGIEFVNEEVKQFDKIGEVAIKFGENVLYTYPVYLKENITYLHTKEIIILFGGLSLFFLLLFVVKWRKEK